MTEKPTDTETLEQAKAMAEWEQYCINYNKKREVKFKNHKSIYLYPIANGINDKMSSYYTKQMTVVPEDGTAGMIVKLKPNSKLQCKAASLAILNNPNWIIGLTKIFFFHWIHWRIVSLKYNPQELLDITTFLIEKMGLQFFFQNTRLTCQMNSLKKKITKTEMMKLQNSSKVEQE